MKHILLFLALVLPALSFAQNKVDTKGLSPKEIMLKGMTQYQDNPTIARQLLEEALEKGHEKSFIPLVGLIMNNTNSDEEVDKAKNEVSALCQKAIDKKHAYGAAALALINFNVNMSEAQMDQAEKLLFSIPTKTTLDSLMLENSLQQLSQICLQQENTAKGLDYLGKACNYGVSSSVELANYFNDAEDPQKAVETLENAIIRFKGKQIYPGMQEYTISDIYEAFGMPFSPGDQTMNLLYNKLSVIYLLNLNDVANAELNLNNASQYGRVDDKASSTLARYYYNGVHTTQDLAKATMWYEKCFQDNPSTSSLMYGNEAAIDTCIDDVAVDTCVVIASDTLMDANEYIDQANAGDVEAQIIVAEAYATGEYGLEKNIQMAEKYLRMANENDKSSTIAALVIANYYHKELNNIEQAAYWYNNADEQRVLDESTWFDAFSDTTAMDSTEMEVDTLAIMNDLITQADNGNVEYQLIVAGLYQTGEIVEKDINKAIEYYEKASENGNSNGYNQIAYLYAQGEEVPQDFAKAHQYIDKAISMFPDDANLYDSKGEFYLMQGKEVEAKSLWKLLKKKFPQEIPNLIEIEGNVFCKTMMNK